MKHLLTNKSFRSPFTTLKNTIKNKTNQIKDYEKMKGIEFEKHIKSLILGFDNKQTKIKSIKRVYEKICLTAGKPIQTMLKEFLNHSKIYNEQDLVQTVVYLAKAYQISLMDHSGNLDRFGYKLHESPMWDHFIEQVKYALSDKAYISNKNAGRVLDALGDMNYVDIQVIKLVMQKIQKILMLPKEEKINFEPRAYQIQKKKYYKSKIVWLNEALLENQKFQKNLQYFQTKRKQYAQKQTFYGVAKSDFETQETYQNVVQLLNTFQKFNQGAEKLIEGVIAVRQQYRKMVTISQNQKVMRNPELNHAILLIEEKLLEMHLITIQDIRSPEKIMHQNNQFKKVQQIVKILMSQARIQNFEDYFATQNKNLSYLKERKQRQLLDLSILIQSLTKYCGSPFRLQGTDDKISLLNIKWQRFFLEQKLKQNNLDVQRMFRKAFAETSIFFARHLPMLQFSLIQGELKAKIHWYSALLQMGYYEQLQSQFKGIKLTEDSFNNLTSDQFLTLIKIINNLYQSDCKPSQQIHHQIQLKIQSILQSGEKSLNISALCNTINYLYQSSSSIPLNNKIYQKLIDLLIQQVQYLQHSDAANTQLSKQAKRILYFESPESGKMSGSLSQLFQIEQIGSQRGNPFLKILNQTFNENFGKGNTSYIITGIDQNNQLAGIYFANSDCSSINGSHVSGNIHAYCLRLYNQYQVKVTPISMNKFIDVNYASSHSSLILNENPKIKMKSSKQIMNLVGKYLPRNNQILIQFISSMGKILNKFNEFEGYQLKIDKIMSSIKKIITLYNQEKQVIMISQFYAKRCQLLVQFQFLKRDVGLLNNQDKLVVQEKLKSQENPKTIDEILSQLQKQLYKSLPQIRNSLKQLQEKQKSQSQSVFKGKRITMNLLPQRDQKKDKNKDELPVFAYPQYQLLSIPYLLDTRYVEYQDWRKQLKSTANFNQIKLQEASDLTKLLALKFLPHVKQTIVAFPDKDANFHVPFYPLNWENTHYYQTHSAQEKNRLQDIAEQYRSAYKNIHTEQNTINKNLVTLQNFKHQLKVSKTPKQILQTILNLKFIDDLLIKKNQAAIHQTTQKASSLFLERNPQQYFNYLERKSDKLYLQSPYLEYIFNKIEQTEKLKEMIQNRKTSKAKLQMLYNQGILNKLQFFNNLKQIDEKLISELKKLKRKSLSHIDGVQILEDSSKIVQLNKNIQDLQKIVQNAVHYDRHQDYDFIAADGNYQEALKIKRSRAENNLIMFKILYQISQKQALTKHQTKFIQNWKKSVVQGISSYKKNINFTNLTIKALSTADKQKLLLSNSNLSKFSQNLALNDLILELNNFLDESVLIRLQSQIYAEHFSKKLNVPSFIFSNFSNKIFNVLNYKVEDFIFQQNSHLNQKQIDTLIEMSKIFKTQGLSDREKYKNHYKNIRQNIQLINKCRFRNPLMTEYLKQKDYEYYNNYYPEDVKTMKKQQTSKLWKSIFGKEQKQTTGSDIRLKVNQICNRMLMIKLRTPPYFGNLVLMILKNQKTDIFTKQKIISYVELFKVPLQIDSSDLLKLARPQQFGYQKLLDQMRARNGDNFVSRISSLL